MFCRIGPGQVKKLPKFTYYKFKFDYNYSPIVYANKACNKVTDYFY